MPLEIALPLAAVFATDLTPQRARALLPDALFYLRTRRTSVHPRDAHRTIVDVATVRGRVGYRSPLVQRGPERAVETVVTMLGEPVD